MLIARFPGSKNPTRRSLGQYGAVTLADARQKAKDWLDLIDAGKDPAVEVERQRAVEGQRRATSWQSVVADYLDQRASKLAKFKEAKTFLQGECAAWNPRPIFDITRLDCAHLIRKIVARGAPAQARNSRGTGSAFFNWAIGTGYYPGLEHNPFAALHPKELIGPKVIRQRILSDDELRAAWKAANDEGQPFGPLVKLWILTAQRKLEWGGASWSEIQPAAWRDDRAIEPSLVIPASRMKKDAGHVVPLVPAVAEILRTIPRGREGEFIFSASNGQSAINGYSKDWDQFCARLVQPNLTDIQPQAITLAVSRTTQPRKGKDVSDDEGRPQADRRPRWPHRRDPAWRALGLSARARGRGRSPSEGADHRQPCIHRAIIRMADRRRALHDP